MAYQLAKSKSILARLDRVTRSHSKYNLYVALLHVCKWVAGLFPNERLRRNAFSFLATMLDFIYPVLALIMDAGFSIWLMLREALYVLGFMAFRLFLIILCNVIAIILFILLLPYLAKWLLGFP